MIVKGLAPDGLPKDPAAVVKVLTDYARTIEPWARAVAAGMVAEVHRRDRLMWRKLSAEIGTQLRREIDSAPTGAMLAQLQESQVRLIKSLPLDAAERVHELTRELMLDGGRAKEIQREILRTQDVTANKAALIARTEVNRATSNLMQARAQYAGSEGYVWRTVGDSDVRDSHDDMEGRYVRWSEPPTLDGLKGHAGTLPNCRCFAEPIFPND